MGYSVHPRMRGEHHWIRPFRRPYTGSSPHARGTLGDPRGHRVALRFIPACAGNTPASFGPQGACPVHPRMRGEHRVRRSFIAVSFGSSPHARGTRGHFNAALVAKRFIPACAGNTRRLSGATATISVHPRMRGEHHAPLPAARTDLGSSPHARGTLPPLVRQVARVRFIPACAGNTLVREQKSYYSLVHPRMRGEHDGSGAGRHRPGRFIPACAGNTSRSLASRRVRSGSSPHARGTLPICRDSHFALRFIPHARGTRVRVRGAAGARRFIPACAGNT